MRFISRSRFAAGTSWLGALLLVASQGCATLEGGDAEETGESSQESGKKTSFVTADEAFFSEGEEEDLVNATP